ncbi:MAG: PEP-CTERM sorting domain-containing protein [Planctomycetes bacterium]|nr:PEP-CTERM sorting domain-containing protein [Planctomycetota bacterium]
MPFDSDTQLLLSNFTSSEARGIWDDGVFTYVAGRGYNATAGREEALMWVVPEPPACGLMLVAGLAGFALLGRHRK